MKLGENMEVTGLNKIIDNTIIGIPIKQNQQDFIIGKFTIEQIFKFTKFTTRILNSFDENGKPIYNEEIQREIENPRANKIADFLIEDPEATFPTNIVLHIPNEAVESFKEHTENFVEIKIKQNVFDEINKSNGDVYITIIDGQHRIKGIELALSRIKTEIDNLSLTLRTSNNSELQKLFFTKTQRLKDLKNIELVVSFFIDKTIEYQAMIFSTINRTQKRVSQSLVYDLFGLDTDDTPQKTAIEVIVTLNGHKSSPFYNRIKFYGGDYSGEISPPLTQAAMAKSIVGLISENLRESERDRYRKRKDLNKRSPGSNKYLPFRKFYANDQDEKISDILFYFFNAVKESFVDKRGKSFWTIEESYIKPQNILQTTVGYDSLLKILVDLLQTENISGVSKTSDFSVYLEKCKDLDFSNTMRYSFNNQGKRILYLEMHLAIWPPQNEDDDRLIELKKILQNH